MADSTKSNLPPSTKGKTSHQYQSLEQLLAQAGYAETRVITPEAVRIKERVQRLWAEEKAQAERAEAAEVERLLFQGNSDDDDDDDGGMTAGFPPMQALPARVQAPPPKAPSPPPAQPKKKDASRDGSFGGWSIGRAQGARLLEDGLVRPLRTRGSALGLTFAAGSSTTTDASDAPATTESGQGRHTPADDCGSLSSASSTVSSDSTMITSPPELASETFVRVRVDSPPDYSRNFGLSDAYASSTSGPHRHSTEARLRSGKPSLSRADSSPRPIPASTELKDDASSAAARSLRKIASQTTLRRVPSLASTSTRTVRPKKSLVSLAAFAAVHPPPPPVPEEPPLTTVRKALRHAASTPFLCSATATISPASDAKGKAPEGWFASLSRFALARSVTEPVAPSTGLRTRPLIPAFGQAMSSAPSTTSLRGVALPGQVTKHVVTCVSDEGDDLPPFSATRIESLFPEDNDDVDDAAAPRTPPVLTPRAEYGEAKAWRFVNGSPALSSSPAGGWPWSGATKSHSKDISVAIPSTPSPPSSPPPPRPLKAQRSIKSLRAALLADSATRPPPPPVPPIPAAYVRIPIFAISSPDTVERGLPPRTLNLSDEAISRMAKGRWSGSGEDDDDETDVGYENDDAGGHSAERSQRDADARGRSRKRGSTRKSRRRD